MRRPQRSFAVEIKASRTKSPSLRVMGDFDERTIIPRDAFDDGLPSRDIHDDDDGSYDAAMRAADRHFETNSNVAPELTPVVKPTPQFLFDEQPQIDLEQPPISPETVALTLASVATLVEPEEHHPTGDSSLDKEPLADETDRQDSVVVEAAAEHEQTHDELNAPRELWDETEQPAIAGPEFAAEVLPLQVEVVDQPQPVWGSLFTEKKPVEVANPARDQAEALFRGTMDAPDLVEPARRILPTLNEPDPLAERLAEAESRRRGRKPGSKNKTTLAFADDSAPLKSVGRPRKNPVTHMAVEAQIEAFAETPPPPVQFDNAIVEPPIKRGRGRPKGSVNTKPKVASVKSWAAMPDEPRFAPRPAPNPNPIITSMIKRALLTKPNEEDRYKYAPGQRWRRRLKFVK